MPRRSCVQICLALVLLGGRPALGGEDRSPPAAADLEFFESRVRPVLVERCQSCHGADKQKGGLRVDSRSAILQGGETGPAAVAGKPDESLIVEAIHYGDALQMPPKSRLPAAEIDALTRWVGLGLPWPDSPVAEAASRRLPGAIDVHKRKAEQWAWQPIKAVTPPAVRDASWPHGAVDRFILAQLDAKGLQPAPDTDRRTLIRRLSFDLIGLPPSPAEVAAFVDDPRSDAVERLVDRLLDSPQFGERWARHWLDLVRYAETRGHEFDPAIPNAWQYRDYVVRALNADLPYDQFLTEHLAGDLLNPPRIDSKTGSNESILGTGFWFLGEEVHSPVDVRQDETDRFDNRLDVMGKTFLGLTIACARCHDHKFDPITQRDYYGLSGFLASSSYRQVRFATIEQEHDTAHALHEADVAARREILKQLAKALRPGVERLTALLDAPPTQGPLAAEWARARTDADHPLHRLVATDPTPPPPALATESVVVDFGKARDLARLQDGSAFGLEPIRLGDPLAGATGETLVLNDRASAWRDPAFLSLGLAEGTQRDHGRLGSWDRSGQTLRTPEFTIRSGHLWYLARGAGRAYAAVHSHLLIAGPLHGSLLTEWTDGNKGWRWVRHDLTPYKGQRAHLEFCPSGAGEVALAMVVDQPDAPPLPDPIGARLHGESPDAVRSGYASMLDDLLSRLNANHFDDADASLVTLANWIIGKADLFGIDLAGPRATLAAWKQSRATIAARIPRISPTAPAMLDGNGVNEPVLIRGSSKRPSTDAPRRFLEALDGDVPLVAPNGGSARLELARRITDRNDPFASRVIVNRVWHHLFGRGIVASVDNFGALGEPPTHPELLDFLADRFIREGWSIKRLIRDLALSRTYQMASRSTPEADAADPNNRLWHRAAIRRLEAEPIRDAILTVSGRLDSRAGGPSVPVHLTSYMQGRGRPSRSGPLEGEGRRSLYLEIRRNFLAPMMLAFDAPIPFTTMGRRNVSNVPAQALILLNDPFVAAEAERWAERVLAGSERTPEGRVAVMYETAFARPPAARETEAAIGFLERQARDRGLASEAWRDDPHVWADLGHVLFNAKEFIFIP